MRTTAFALAGCLLLALPILGCGGGGGSGGPAGDGLVTVSALDAPAAGLAGFVLDVTSFDLVATGGGVAPVFDGAARLDFAAASEQARMFGAAYVPAGLYDAADVTLDFSELEARRPGGKSVDVYDESGTVLLRTTLQLRLRLETALAVGNGTPQHLLFDLDLGQSLEPIGGDESRLRMRVVARVRTQAEVQTRTTLEGELVSVEPGGAAAGLTMQVGPDAGGPSAQLRIRAEAGTTCSGGGGAGSGAPGLGMLQAHLGERVMVMARYRHGDGAFVADEVCFGGNVPGDAVDVALGYVADYDGTTWTILGAHLTHAGGPQEFGTDLEALLDGGTVVTLLGEVVTLADIGPGQHVMLSGTLLPGPTPVLDCRGAASGAARLLETSVTGTVLGIVDGPVGSEVSLVVERFSLYPVALFDLLGHDADPDDYLVLTDADVSALLAGDVVTLRGFVQGELEPFDFEAFETTVPVPDTAATLSVSWDLPGAPAPFGGDTAFPLVLDLTGTYLAEVTLEHGAVTVPLAGSPWIALPPGGATGTFSIRQGAEITTYAGSDATLWLADLNARLGTGLLAVRLSGHGEFADTVPQVFSADSLSITVRNP